MHDTLGEGCDLVMLFASYHHLTAFAEAAESIRRTLSPRVMLGVTAEAVLGGAMELEGKAGLAAIGLRLPGATLHPFITTPQRPTTPTVVSSSNGCSLEKMSPVASTLVSISST